MNTSVLTTTRAKRHLWVSRCKSFPAGFLDYWIIVVAGGSISRPKEVFGEKIRDIFLGKPEVQLKKEVVI